MAARLKKKKKMWRGSIKKTSKTLGFLLLLIFFTHLLP